MSIIVLIKCLCPMSPLCRSWHVVHAHYDGRGIDSCLSPGPDTELVAQFRRQAGGASVFFAFGRIASRRRRRLSGPLLLLAALWLLSVSASHLSEGC